MHPVADYHFSDLRAVRTRVQITMAAKERLEGNQNDV